MTIGRAKDELLRAVESFVPDVEGRRQASVALLEELQMAALAAGLEADFSSATDDRGARVEITHPRPRNGRAYGVVTLYEKGGQIYLDALGGGDRSMYWADPSIEYDAVEKRWTAPDGGALVRVARWAGNVLAERAQR